MTEKNRVYTWYIEPLDSYTSQVIASRLDAGNFLDGVVCGDGKTRMLWRCDYDFVNFISRSRAQLSLQFDIFNQFGQETIQSWQRRQTKNRFNRARRRLKIGRQFIDDKNRS